MSAQHSYSINLRADVCNRNLYIYIQTEREEKERIEKKENEQSEQESKRTKERIWTKQKDIKEEKCRMEIKEKRNYGNREEMKHNRK